MKAIYAKDFNGNESQQDYQLETIEEKINRLKNYGYKEVLKRANYNNLDAVIPLNVAHLKSGIIPHSKPAFDNAGI